MVSRKLDKAEWEPVFDFLSKQFLQGKRVEVEVAGLDLGDQVETKWLPLVGIVYDHKDDIVEVALEDGDNHIDHIIYGVEDAGLFINLDVLDGDGRHQIVKTKDPMMLPASLH